MNYLAHLFLSPENEQVMVGNLMGDFVKGNRFDYLPKNIVAGIYLHRKIDRFTDQHEQVKSLKAHLSNERKKFSGIITDIVFDHLLAINWREFSDLELTEFAKASYQSLDSHQMFMPERMQQVVSRMIAGDWLSFYQHLDNTGRAIDGVSRRIRFENQLAGAIEEVKDNYSLYQTAFEQFFPELLVYSRAEFAEIILEK